MTVKNSRRFAGQPLIKEKGKKKPSVSASLNYSLRGWGGAKLTVMVVLVRVIFYSFLVLASTLVGAVAYVYNFPVTLKKPPEFLQYALNTRVPNYAIAVSNLKLNWDMSARAFVATSSDARFTPRVEGMPATIIPHLELQFPMSNLLRLNFFPGLISINKLALTLDIPEKSTDIDYLSAIREGFAFIKDISDISIHKAHLTFNLPASKSPIKLDLVGYKSKDYVRVVASLPTIDSKQVRVELLSHDANTLDIALFLDKMVPLRVLDTLKTLSKEIPPEWVSFINRFPNTITGKITVRVDCDKGVSDLFTDIHVGSGSLHLPTLHTRPYTLTSARVKAHFGLSGVFIENTDVTFPEGKIALFVKSPYKHKKGHYEGSVSLKGTDIDVSRLKNVWPENLSLRIRTWIVENMSKGEISQITCNATVKSLRVTDKSGLILGDLFKKENHTLSNIHGATKLTNASVEYMNGMPLVTDVSASGAFDANTFNLTFTHAKSGDISVTGGGLTIAGLREEDQSLTISIATKSTLHDALALANEKPLRLLDDYDIAPGNFSGDLLTKLTLAFPLTVSLSPKMIRADVEAQATHAQMKQIIDGYDLPLEDGRFTIQIVNHGEKPRLYLAGKGTCLGEEVSIEAEDRFWVDAPAFKDHERRTITLATQVTDKHLFRVIPQLSATLSGKAPLTVVRKVFHRLAGEPNGSVEVSLNLTPVLLDLPVVKLHKPHDEAAVLQAKIILHDDDIIRIDSAEIHESERIRLALSADWDGKNHELQRATFAMNFPENDIDLVYIKSKKDIPTTDARFGYIDLKALMNLAAKDQAKESPTPASNAPSTQMFNLKMQNIAYDGKALLDELSGKLTLQGTEIIAGNIEGKRLRDKDTDVFKLQIARHDSGDVEYKIAAKNLESLVAALEFETKVKSSEVEISLKRRVDGNKGWKGSYKLKDFLLANAPPVIRLLKVLSPTAITEIFSKQEGVVLNSVTGSFRYHDDILTLLQGRAASPSVGFTFEGTVELDTQQLDITGTVIPAYGLNAAIGYIPVVGHILSGGPGQGLVAFNFAMQGTYADPQVTSNPLSALAPGLVKRIFSNVRRDNRKAKTDKPLTAPPNTHGPAKLPGVPTKDHAADAAIEEEPAEDDETPDKRS